MHCTQMQSFPFSFLARSYMYDIFLRLCLTSSGMDGRSPFDLCHWYSVLCQNKMETTTNIFYIVTLQRLTMWSAQCSYTSDLTRGLGRDAERLPKALQSTVNTKNLPEPQEEGRGDLAENELWLVVEQVVAQQVPAPRAPVCTLPHSASLCTAVLCGPL